MKNKLLIGAALGCSLLASSTTAYALSTETEAGQPERQLVRNRELCPGKG